MDIGVVLPNAAPAVDGPTLLDWAARIEGRGFSTVGVIGRIAYPTHEELVTLSAVAGATTRVRLLTSTLVAPLRDPILLAKQAASIDRLSGGRLVLGLSAGMRADDFVVTGTNFRDRGRRFDAMLATMHSLWQGDPPGEGSREACPAPVGGRIPIYFGALSPAPKIIRRIARWGDGFIAVGSPVMVAPMIDAIHAAWEAQGRDGKIRLVGASYFALGHHAVAAEAERNIMDYYSDFFPQLGAAAAAAMIRTPEAARRMLRIFEDAGFDEFNFSAAAADPDQVDRLADAVL